MIFVVLTYISDFIVYFFRALRDAHSKIDNEETNSRLFSFTYALNKD